MAAMFGSNRANTWGNPLLNRPAPAATPAAQLQGFDPMQSFMGLLPGLLQQQGAFARPEANQFLAQLFGQQPGAWAGGSAPRAADSVIGYSPRSPAVEGIQLMRGPDGAPQYPPDSLPLPGTGFAPTMPGATPWMPGFTGEPGSGPVSAPSPARHQGGLAGMIQQMMARMQQGTTSTSPGARGPAPSPFTGLRRFAGPFGNGGGGISPGLNGFATQAY